MTQIALRERTRAHYDEYPFIEGGPDRIAWWKQYLREFLPDEEIRGRRLLDVGSSVGEIARGLRERGADVTCLDLSGASLRRCRQINPGGAVLQASALDLPFPDASFDHVISIGVLHHTPDCRRGFAEAARVVKPGGRVVVFLYNSRNIYRCDPRSFALDEQALAHALEGMASGHDIALRPLERVFFYLPLEHSESIELQQQSVRLYEGLLNEVGEKLAQPFTGFLDYARRHLEVIQRFGRFPHRNAILGRESTAAEIEYLQQPGSGF